MPTGSPARRTRAPFLTLCWQCYAPIDYPYLIILTELAAERLALDVINMRLATRCIPAKGARLATIEQHMNPRVLTVSPQDTLEQAAQAMIERKVGSAVVVKDGAHVGIVTERDVLRAVARGTVPWSTKIEDVMTADPICAEPAVEISKATQIMLEGGFRHLPVVQDGKLTGIVSLRDLLILAQGPQDTNG